jgi:biopolymer transport protein ExbB
MGARIFLAMIKRSSSGQTFSEHHVERAAETEAVKCINSLENGFSFLIALGSISPLTGFLGTVSGMIGAFRSIAEATEVNAQIVANGIYEALITTVFGLVIAIIAMIFHSIFSHIVDKFATRIEGSCSELIDRIVQVKLKQAKLIQAKLAQTKLTQAKPAQVNKTTKKSQKKKKSRIYIK